MEKIADDSGRVKKILYVATVVKKHIVEFHIPYLKMLKEMGYETAVAARNDYEDPADCVIPYCDKYYDIPFEREPYKPGNIKAYKMLRGIMEREDYDIIHCHTPVGGVIGRLAAMSVKGSKVVYTAHGFHFYDGAPLLNWLLYYPVERFLSRYTDVLITINHEDYERASKDFHAKKTVYVPGVGIDTNKFKPDAALRKQKRAELGLSDDEFAILNVGELIPRKNQRLLIEAVGELAKETKGKRKIRCFIAGTGRLEVELKQISHDLGVGDKVTFLGYRRDIAGLLNACDLFVFMSRQEGLPVALMEAMACGCPVICSDIRGNRDLIKDGENGWGIALEKIDPAGLAEVIKKIIADGNVNSREDKLQEEYGIERVTEQMKFLIDKI